MAVGVFLGYDGPLPRRFGVTLAVAAFLSGAGLGLRGYIPVCVGLVSYLVAGAVSYTPPPTGRDNPAGVVVIAPLFCAYYALPTLAGVVARRLALSMLRRA